MKDDLSSLSSLNHIKELTQLINDNINELNLTLCSNINQIDLSSNLSYQKILEQFDNIIGKEILKELSSKLFSMQMDIELLHSSNAAGQFKAKAEQKEHHLNQLISSYQSKDDERNQLSIEKEEEEKTSMILKKQSKVKAELLLETISLIDRKINHSKEDNKTLSKLIQDSRMNLSEHVLFSRENYLTNIEKELKCNNEIDVQKYQERLDIDTQGIKYRLSNKADDDNNDKEEDINKQSMHQNDDNENEDNDNMNKKRINKEEHEIYQKKLLKKINKLKQERFLLKEKIEEMKETINTELFRANNDSLFQQHQNKLKPNSNDNTIILFILAGLSIILTILIINYYSNSK